MLAGLLIGGVDLGYLEFGLPGALLMAPGILLGALGWLALPLWPRLGDARGTGSTAVGGGPSPRPPPPTTRGAGR